MIDGGTPQDGFPGPPDWEQINREAQDRENQQLRDVGSAAVSSRPQTDRPTGRAVWGVSGGASAGERPDPGPPLHAGSELFLEPSLDEEASVASEQRPPQPARPDTAGQAQASRTGTRGQEQNDTTTLSSAGLLAEQDDEPTDSVRQGEARRDSSDSEPRADVPQRPVDSRPSTADDKAEVREAAPQVKEYARNVVEVAEGYAAGLGDHPEWREAWIRDVGMAQVEALREQRPGQDIWVLVADAKGDATKFIEEARKAGYRVADLSVFDGLNTLNNKQKAAALGNAVSVDNGGSPSQYASVIKEAAEGVVREYSDPENGATVRVRGAQSYEQARDALHAAHNADPTTVETLTWEEQEEVRRKFGGGTKMGQDIPLIVTASRYLDHLIPDGVSYEIDSSTEQRSLVQRETSSAPEAAPRSDGEVRVLHIRAEGQTDIEQEAQEKVLGFELIPMVAKNTPPSKPDAIVIPVDGLPGRAVKQVVTEAIKQRIVVVLTASEVPDADTASSLAKRGVRAYGTPDLTQAENYSKLAHVRTVEEVASTTGNLAVSYSGGDHESLSWEAGEDDPKSGTTSKDRDGWNVNRGFSQTINHNRLKSSAPVDDLLALQPGEAAILDPRGNSIGVYDMATGRLIEEREFPTPEPEPVDFDEETRKVLDHHRAGRTTPTRMNAGLEVEEDPPPDAKGGGSRDARELQAGDNPPRQPRERGKPEGLRPSERKRTEDIRRLRMHIGWGKGDLTYGRASRAYTEQKGKWAKDVVNSLNTGGKLAEELLRAYPEWDYRPPTHEELREAWMIWHDIKPGLSRRVGRTVGGLARRVAEELQEPPGQ